MRGGVSKEIDKEDWDKIKKRLETLQKPFAVDKMEKISKSKNVAILKSAELFGEDGIEELDKLMSELDASNVPRSQVDDTRATRLRPYEKYDPIYPLQPDEKEPQKKETKEKLKEKNSSSTKKAPKKSKKPTKETEQRKPKKMPKS